MSDLLTDIRQEARDVIAAADEQERQIASEFEALKKRLEEVRAGRVDAETILKELAKVLPEKERKAPVKITEAQVRDWAKTLGDAFTTSMVAENFNVSRQTARRVIALLENRGTVARNGERGPKVTYHFNKPTATNGRRERRRSHREDHATDAPKRGEAVPGTGTMGSPKTPKALRDAQRTGKKIK